MRSTAPADREVVERLGVVFPDQGSYGTHVNISGAALARNARHRDAAVKFVEYLAGDDAQRMLADGNNEYPAVPGVRSANPALAALGPFKAESIAVAKVGANTAQVQRMLDRVGFK